jgi:hypothetical protein
MWTWQVEGLVQDRIDTAIREAEQQRRLRMAEAARTESTHRGWLRSVKASLRLGELVAGWLPSVFTAGTAK